MNPNDMAQANWRLDNPAATDITSHKQFGGTAAAEGSWASPVDKGWHAAKAVIAPSSNRATMAGLPVPRRTWCPARSAARSRPRRAGQVGGRGP
jgi:hypothetical protein